MGLLVSPVKPSNFDGYAQNFVHGGELVAVDEPREIGHLAAIVNDWARTCQRCTARGV